MKPVSIHLPETQVNAAGLDGLVVGERVGVTIVGKVTSIAKGSIGVNVIKVVSGEKLGDADETQSPEGAPPDPLTGIQPGDGAGYDAPTQLDPRIKQMAAMRRKKMQGIDH